MFAELLSTLDAASRQGALFPGQSCYPLSPVRRQLPDQDGNFVREHGDDSEDCVVVYDRLDQLSVILQTLGTNNCDCGFLARDDAREFVQQFASHKLFQAGENWAELYPGASAEARSLLARMLTFNYAQRPFARQLLAHPFVAGFARPRPVREEPPRVLTLDFEVPYLSRSLGFFLDEKDLRVLFLRELYQHHTFHEYPIYYKFVIQALLEGIALRREALRDYLRQHPPQ